MLIYCWLLFSVFPPVRRELWTFDTWEHTYTCKKTVSSIVSQTQTSLHSEIQRHFQQRQSEIRRDQTQIRYGYTRRKYLYYSTSKTQLKDLIFTSWFQVFVGCYYYFFYNGVSVVTFSWSPKQSHFTSGKWSGTQGTTTQKGVHTWREEGRPLLGETSQEQRGSQTVTGEEKDEWLRAGESSNGPERRKCQA